MIWSRRGYRIGCRLRSIATGRDPSATSYLLVAAIIAGAASCRSTSDTGESARDAARVAPVEGWLDDLASWIEAEREAKEIPALSIALVRDGELLWSRGFGWEDDARTRRASGETIYRVGSVSKLFTALALAQLDAEDKLDLDAPITDVLPEFSPQDPFDAPPLTLRQVLSHRSGLVREPPVGHYFDATSPSLADTVASLNSTRLVYRPGSRTKYSNAALAVAGRALEVAWDRPFAAEIRRRFLLPLGMAASSFEASDIPSERLASAFMWSLDGRRFAAPGFALGTSSAGNLYSSVEDLARFAIALFSDDDGPGVPGVSRPVLESMWKVQSGAERGFGLGFFVSEFQGERRVSHDGAIYGYSSSFQVLPDRRLAVVAASSLDVTNAVVGRIARTALEGLLETSRGGTFTVPAPSRPPEPRHLEWAGLYRDGQRFVELERRDDRLVLIDGRQSIAELRLVGGELQTDDRHHFGVPVSVEVGRGLRVGRRVFTRIADALPAPAPEKWRPLLGEYGQDHNVLFVLERYGQLFVLIEWIDLYPIDEISPDVFRFPDWGLYHGERLVFSRGADGTVEQVTAAGIAFRRRPESSSLGESFRIELTQPIEELRAAAREATPPAEDGEFLPSDLVELKSLDPTLRYDIRYAGTNNFMGAAFYRTAAAYLQRPAAQALVRVHRALEARGYGILVHDAYRPWSVTKMFWDGTPEAKRDFVADPAKGSRHNRGCAVDITLYDRATGEPVAMLSGYDEFTERAYPNYVGGSSRQRYLRGLLRRAMADAGFTVYEYEWWHFDFQSWKSYAIENRSFEELAER